MAKSLDELKEALSTAFDKAIERGKEFLRWSDPKYIQAGAQALLAAAEAAKAIALIEREQREAKERGFNRLDKN